MIDNLTLAKEVQSAINKGARTLRAIRRQTGRSEDQIGQALAYLLLTARTTRTETRGGARLYFPSNRGRFRRVCLDEPIRSFSSLRGLMPRARSLNSV